MTRLLACLALAAVFAGCGEVRDSVPDRFEVVERISRDTAYVRDPRHDTCFLVIGAEYNYQMMASVSCDALRTQPAAANSR